MLQRIQRPVLLALLLPALLASGCRSAAHVRANDRLEERGWMQLQLGDADGALQSFAESLEQQRDARALAGSGQALVALGRSHQARTAFLEAIELEPNVADWRVGLGLVEASLRDDHAALGAFDAAIEVDAGSAKAFYNRARLHAAAGRYEVALDDYSAAIARAERLAEAYAGRGLVWAALDDRDAAIADFHRAGGLEPCPEAHANCAVVHYADGDVRHALAELNTAIRLEGSNPAFYANRARIYLDLGRTELAIEDLEDALGLAPGWSDARDLHRAALEQQREPRAVDGEGAPR